MFYVVFRAGLVVPAKRTPHTRQDDDERHAHDALDRHELEKRHGAGAHNWGREEIDQL